MIWVTRENVHVDRVACPWLIKHFVDKEAQFIFLPREDIQDYVSKTAAIPFDTGTGVELDHYEENGEKYCTFDAIIKKYKLEKKPALVRLGEIVRAADTDRLAEEPLASGLEAIASGAPLLVDSDHEALELEFPFYDVLYTYLKREIIVKKFENKIKTFKTRKERNIFIKQKVSEI